MTRILMTTDPTIFLSIAVAGLGVLAMTRLRQRPKRRARPEIEILRSLDQRHWVTVPAALR